ncbi:hypothetical protein GYMLUDRAFT_249130 [Collybiopsis luxurians FD-317 M1]|uniref:Uncharacterized protein n=1 Tax=Collybiopsis luxurians FD-317 M1 TaxID=944289 RepID=A0A0D0CIZ4_9AGAR|nr:hypothetical protein GYMLUDRAFT_249130 [Collybiopsis luxurians FD-317 M1]
MSQSQSSLTEQRVNEAAAVNAMISTFPKPALPGARHEFIRCDATLLLALSPMFVPTLGREETVEGNELRSRAAGEDVKVFIVCRAELRNNVPAYLDIIVGLISFFPFVQSSTRTEHVVTEHSLRLPKPPPGSVLYSRSIVTVNEHLRFIHTDASNPAHFDAYTHWQNSGRVSVGWREYGPDEKHRNFADMLMDSPY